MSIRTRLALLFGTTALVLLVGGGFLFVTQLANSLNGSLNGTLATRADNLSSALGSFRSASGFDRRVLRGGPSGTYAQLLTADGRLLVGSRLLVAQPVLPRAAVRAARHRTVVVDRTVELTPESDRRSENMRLLARRLRPSGDVLVVAMSREVVDEAVTSARNQLLLLGVAVLVLTGPGAWLLTRAALRPVERMRREVRELEASNAAVTLQVPRTHDEIARLAETFNVVLARMHAAVAHEQALVADAGHELRTPLTVLKGELELARRPHRTREELASTVEVAAEETERLVRLAEDLLFLSREDTHRATESFDVVEVARRSVEALAGAAQRRHVELRLEGDDAVPCVGNRDWIRRAVDNLLTNALRYAPDGSTVTVSVVDDDGCVELAVADEGPGFPPEFLPMAFDRFTRADDARRRAPAHEAHAGGSGLGLAIVRSIVLRHGGRAVAANRPGGGAVVTLRWPRG